MQVRFWANYERKNVLTKYHNHLESYSKNVCRINSNYYNSLNLTWQIPSGHRHIPEECSSVVESTSNGSELRHQGMTGQRAKKYKSKTEATYIDLK